VIKDLRNSDPESVGPYRLLRRLGTGGMGQVYLARSPGGRLVAIKLVRPELADERGFRSRFASEIAAARGVSGVFTAAVIDADADADQPWMATVYVPGPSLYDAVSDDGPLPLRSLFALAAGLAEALHAIHEAGLVHRDLKPSNVLLAGDGPRVIDFGISRALERSMLTSTGVVLGSPGFMSPEQARAAREVGPPSDVFSLGAVLVFAATGNGPFGSGPTPALLYRVVNEEPDLSGVPASIRPLVERCLAKDPAARPTSAELLAELNGEVGPLEEDWLPATVAEHIHRYVETVETPRDVSADAGGTAVPGAVLSTDDGLTTQDIHDAGSLPPEAGPREPGSGEPEPGLPEPTGVSPASPVRGRGIRLSRRWSLGVAAAAVVIAVAVATDVALSSGATPKVLAGPTGPVPSVVASSAHLAATRTPTPKPATTTQTTKKPAAKPTRPRTQQATTPPPATSPAAPATTQQFTPPATTAPATTAPATHAPSGPQAISSYSGASAVSCQEYGSVGSAGGSGVSYSFVNNSGADIQVWFLTTGGSGNRETTVSAGQSFSPAVATGEYWMVAGADSGCLSIFHISASGEVVTS